MAPQACDPVIDAETRFSVRPAVAALDLLLDALKFVVLSLWPHRALAAENLLLRKPLALDLESQIEPREPGILLGSPSYCFPDCSPGKRL
jgi:hypothetical protein